MRVGLWFIIVAAFAVFAESMFLVFYAGHFDAAFPMMRDLGKVQVTMYVNVPEQTDSTPNYTSIGTYVHAGGCAVSQDFLTSGEIIYGDVVVVPELHRAFIVNDCMHIRHKRTIDLFTFDLKCARQFGLKKLNAYVIKPFWGK